jgi:hypothetical protein
VKKEVVIYFVLLLFSALLIHSDLLTKPAVRLEMMSDRSNYYHPFVFGFILYLVVGIFRLIVVGIKKLIKR